jgi:ELWxxDGT repeat protein
MFFGADDGVNGHELWVTDGTVEGTRLVKDIRPGNEGSFLSKFVEVDGLLYFGASDGDHGQELWVSDGTEEGTQMVRDINAGPSSSL